jgi:hypothetical protein
MLQLLYLDVSNADRVFAHVAMSPASLLQKKLNCDLLKTPSEAGTILNRLG